VSLPLLLPPQLLNGTDGFTLMVLYFLVHVKQPPVLPNLQRIAPIRPLSEEEMMLEGRNVYFFDDVETLRQEWSSINFETVGELSVENRIGHDPSLFPG
jgi:terminal uridylyltransferase